MAFERVADILEHARLFHRKLSELYAERSGAADKEKIGVLLNYMSRHEERMAEVLASQEADAAQKVLNTWFKFPPEMPKCECFECVNLRPDMTLQELVQASMKVDQCLLGLYQSAAEKAHTPEVKELFQKILEMERREENQALRRALEFDQDA